MKFQDEQKKSRYQKKENECVELAPADYPEYEGKIVQFTITEDSPVQINLGTIKLDAVKN